MEMSLEKRFAARRLVLLVGLGMLACLALADASSAAVPGGNACVASDGKINGRGATFQKKLVLAFGSAYREDVCGETGTGSTENGEAGNTMVAYNYPAAETAGLTGSGNGIKAASCRTDAFAGSDKPYNNAQLKELNGAPGATGGCVIGFKPPF